MLTQLKQLGLNYRDGLLTDYEFMMILVGILAGRAATLTEGDCDYPDDLKLLTELLEKLPD